LASTTDCNATSITGSIEEVLRRYWGFDRFLPLQKQAMECVCQGRDSIVVLPTGGGKSLCFQAPALVLPGLTVVVSPLISLMKDQIDSLLECGISAGRLDSTMSHPERNQTYDKLRSRALKLLYVSPERLLMEGFLGFLKDNGISSIAIDEAHCVSMWGHDFRPEYSQLSVLRDAVPGVPIGAYTATATEQVRRDIAGQLRLNSPEILVGQFDRPNLIYRVRRRTNAMKQIRDVLDRHPGESGIIYCIRRSDVDEMSATLAGHGYSAAPYHAGMTDDDRKKNQNAFIEEEVSIIVATVAFGMGIDKSNVRYVIHAAMPRSLEHYQQETGRAGRDGLDAECYLFYTGSDYSIWKSILQDSEAQTLDMGMAKLTRMYRYCSGVACRHRAILNYFGQNVDRETCRACDICLGEVEGVSDALIVAQKILSSILRQGERFGADYTAGVLIGSREDRIISNLHDKLSTYGLLKHATRSTVRDWIEQLEEQDCLRRGDYGVLKITDKGRRVLKGIDQPLLLESTTKKSAPKPSIAVDSWAGVDRSLFEKLRRLRSRLAREKNVPAYIVFGDATLRELARKRPSNAGELLDISGIGMKKLRDYGDDVLRVIAGNEEAD
jgi:ATP-dependent DNA helicase RecQ